MSTDKTYNGWSNYETWAAGMHLDGNYGGQGTYLQTNETVRDSIKRTRETNLDKNAILYGVTTALEEMVREELPETKELAGDLLNAAFSEINWRELAEHKIEEAMEDPDFAADLSAESD